MSKSWDEFEEYIVGEIESISRHIVDSYKEKGEFPVHPPESRDINIIRQKKPHVNPSALLVKPVTKPSH